jgi:hypothetical protein
MGGDLSKIDGGNVAANTPAQALQLGVAIFRPFLADSPT